MEANNDDIIYDLETATHEEGSLHAESLLHAEDLLHAEGAECQEAQRENEDSEDTESSESFEDSADTEDTDSTDGSEAEKEIKRMVGEMGAETLLEIIRDNRNAAIRQIISEVEATQRRDIPSGSRTSRKPASIFDLAALA